ncbi:MAG: divalent metal cation transporter [Candidatus Nezhaarchaeales archaeon]
MRRLSNPLEVIISGVVAGVANIDACAILSLLLIGSIYGFSLLWALVLGLLIYVVVLQLTSELTLMTRRGLVENIKSNMRPRETSLIVLSSVAANLSLLSAEVSGIAIPLASLFDLPLTVAIAASALLVFTTSSLKPCNLADKVLMALCLVAFLAIVFKVPPNPQAVVAGLIAPGLSAEPEYWVGAMAMMGIAVGPNVILFEAGDLVEKRAGEESLMRALASIVIGALFCLVICLAVMTYGAALPLAQEDLGAAVEVSIRTFGRAFTMVFLIGLLASSILSAIVTSQSTIALLSEACGLRGERRGLREWVAWSAAITIVSTLPVLLVTNLIKIAFVAAIINSVAAVPLLIYLVKLCTNPSLMGDVEIKGVMKVILQATVGVSAAINIGGVLLMVAKRPLLGYVTLPADVLILAIAVPLAFAMRRLSFIKRGVVR